MNRKSSAGISEGTYVEHSDIMGSMLPHHREAFRDTHNDLAEALHVDLSMSAWGQ